MKLIIAGGRDIKLSVEFLNETFDILFPESEYTECPTEIISGGCSGIDISGETWAGDVGSKVTLFPADWDKHGKAAGPIRNRQMAEYGDELLLIWDGKSRGSANMKKEMEKLGKPVKEVILRG